MADFPDFAGLGNVSLIEDMYQRYLVDPASIDLSWIHFFQGIDFAKYLGDQGRIRPEQTSCRIASLVQAYRRFGHLRAKVNPIQTNQLPVPELELENLGFANSDLGQIFPTLGFCSKNEATLQEIIQAVEAIYCSRIGFEYMDVDSREIELWIQKLIEPGLDIQTSIEEKHFILESLNRSEILETFLNTKYQGQTRFSLEGAETLIPVLNKIIRCAADQGVEAFVLGMSHRGRLNVLMNVLEKPYSIVFKEFEDTIPYAYGESGDVKYHKGFSADVQTASGKSIHLHLTANSSALESVDPIVLGQTKAKQVLTGDEQNTKIGAILIHGDAAIAGQGIVYETLQMGKIPGFSTNGTIHIVVNNQIGYTTLPKEGRSTRYCTDIAKTFGAPVFHVNVEDPESCVFAAQLALEIRLKFQCDVFIDLVGYRKHGHNEGDEPSYTQPLQYKEIRAKKPIRQIYLDHLLAGGYVEQKIAESLETTFKELLAKGFELGKIEEPVEHADRYGKGWVNFVQPSDSVLFEKFDTKVARSQIKQVIDAYCTIPVGFHLHPKLEKWLGDRRAQIDGDAAKPSIDWAAAECMAFGTILLQGTPIRLAGEDSIRGTFSQRHAGWFDQENGSLYVPFAHIDPKQARFDVYNTILSEYGALGFELGYTWSNSNSLVIWEAQYGDFINGGQIPIDHYIVCAEQRWNRYSSLTLLLPHGYEGGGAEHSSGRLERFLQLSGNNNIQVVYPSTPAQYFHLLRRQALRPIKKPLIIFTPKSLLRLPACTSSLNDCTEGVFEEILDDPKPPAKPKKLVFCSGKFFYDLLPERSRFPDAALIRIEQLYPLHLEKMNEVIDRYKGIEEWCWIQEEPENMGAGEFICHKLQELMPKNMRLRIIARPRSAASATGSKKIHKSEQAALIQALQGTV